MPYKVNAEKRRGAPRVTSPVTNGRRPDPVLRQRGSPTVWFAEEATAGLAGCAADHGRGQPYQTLTR